MPELPKMPEHNKKPSGQMVRTLHGVITSELICAPDCPACLYIKLAKYLVELQRERLTLSLKPLVQFVAVRIPAADWAEIKRLAEEQ